MSGAKFNVGELVFAKMKGYPPWPSKILHVTKKTGKVNTEAYEVYFLGTTQRGTCSKNSIFPYSSEFKKKNAALEKKRYAKRYLNALRIMEDQLFRGKILEVPLEVKKAFSETVKEKNKSVLVAATKANNSIEKIKYSAEDNHTVLTRSRSDSKTCLVSKIENANQLKRKVVADQQPVIKLRRIDDIYTSLKTKKTINLTSTVTVNPPAKPKTTTTKTKGIIKIKKNEDLFESSRLEDDTTAAPLKEFRHNTRIIGQELYRTTQGSPFVIQNVCTVDENFFRNNTSVPSFITTPDPLRICSPEVVPKVLPGMYPMPPLPPLPPLQPKPVHRKQYGSKMVLLQPNNSANKNKNKNNNNNNNNNDDNKGPQYLLVQPEPPLPALKPIKRTTQNKGKRYIKKPMKCNKLRNYVPPPRHNDHDYMKISGKMPSKNVTLEEHEEEVEEEEIFQKLRMDIFETKKEMMRDPLDITEMQSTDSDNPDVDLNIFNPEVVVKEEPNNGEMETELVSYPEQILEDTAVYNCTKCNHTFSKNSFERHKCGTLQFDNINSINIHNTLRSVIEEQNWHNRKIFFTCSVCKKNCHNVEELADHLNEYHRNKSLIPKDPLALDGHIENESKKKDVKLMVCNMLTPLSIPPKNAKSVIKLNSNNPLPAPNVPKTNQIADGKRHPVLVCDNTGKQFLLIPQNEIVKGKPLDVNKIMSTMPSIPKLNLGKPFIFPPEIKKKVEKKVVVDRKPTKSVFMNRDLSSLNSDSSCTLSASDDDDVRYKSKRTRPPRKNKKLKTVTIRDFSIS